MTFAPDVVAAVVRHMNDDHAGDCLLICRALGGQPTASAARLSGVDAGGFDFVATVDGAAVPVRVPFGHRLTDRREIRAEAVQLYHEARARLAAPPP